MGRPDYPCGDCAYYARVHVRGPHNYGTCRKNDTPTYHNASGCGSWVWHRSVRGRKIIDDLKHHKGKGRLRMPDKRTEFERELERLINKHSMENGSNTPDFLLAEYLMGCLSLYNRVTTRRRRWQETP